MSETVTTSLLRTIIEHWPDVPSHLIHSAGREYCLSGGQRLRQLKKEYQDIDYIYQSHNYHFRTPLLILQWILKEKESK